MKQHRLQEEMLVRLAHFFAGALEGHDGPSCRLSMQVDDLGWPLMVLATVGAPFDVESPPELADEVRRVAALFGSPRR